MLDYTWCASAVCAISHHTLQKQATDGLEREVESILLTLVAVKDSMWDSSRILGRYMLECLVDVRQAILSLSKLLFY